MIREKWLAMAPSVYLKIIFSNMLGEIFCVFHIYLKNPNEHLDIETLNLLPLTPWNTSRFSDIFDKGWEPMSSAIMSR